MNDCPDGRLYVRNLLDKTYQVVYESYAYQIGSMMCETLEDVLYQGSIADCEAFIRLREKGQI
jgi:hypothetical protein